MKKITALLGFVACVLAVSTVSATPEFSGTQGATNTPSKKKASAKVYPRYATHYITSVPVTGSHLPLVVCRYQGSTYSQSPNSTYGPQLDQSSQFGVAGQLNQRDPAISSAGFRR